MENDKKSEKREYVKPEVRSEDLMVYGGLCDGTPTGGAKTATASPHFCNITKLLS